jgi:hypothetical protein
VRSSSSKSKGWRLYPVVEAIQALRGMELTGGHAFLGPRQLDVRPILRRWPCTPPPAGAAGTALRLALDGSRARSHGDRGARNGAAPRTAAERHRRRAQVARRDPVPARRLPAFVLARDRPIFYVIAL